MTDAQYDAYLGGSETVHVKPYDEYMGIGAFDPDNVNVASEYAFIKLNNADGTPSVGNDGNTASHIVDPRRLDGGAVSRTPRVCTRSSTKTASRFPRTRCAACSNANADTDMFVLDPDQGGGNGQLHDRRR